VRILTSHISGKKKSRSYLVSQLILVLGGLQNSTTAPWSLQTTTSSSIIGATPPHHVLRAVIFPFTPPHHVDDGGVDGNITALRNLYLGKKRIIMKFYTQLLNS
jgi:hypothetical protein